MWFILVDLYFGGPVSAITNQMRCYRSLGTCECVHSYLSHYACVEYLSLNNTLCHVHHVLLLPWSLSGVGCLSF